MNWTKIISWTTPTLVFVLAIISFILSYSALRSVAYTNVYENDLAYLWPLLLDGALIVFSLATIWFSLIKENTWLSYILVFTFTTFTIIFNILHSSQTTAAVFIAAIPPATLFLTFHILMSMLRVSAIRQNIQDSISQLKTQLATLQDELGQVERHLRQEQEKLAKVKDTKSVTIKQLDATIKSRQAELEKLERHPVFVLGTDINTPDQRRDILRQLVDIQNQDKRVSLTQGDMAAALGVSVKTLQRDLEAISVNGNS